MIALFRPAAVLVGLLATLLLAACGGDDEGESPEATGTPVASVSITETDFALDPSEPRVEETGVIEFKLSNEGNVEHNLEVETPQGEFELAENIPPGQTATLKAEIQEPGQYTIYCPVADHRERGMEGTLTVAGGAGGGSEDGEQESGGGGGSGGGY